MKFGEPAPTELWAWNMAERFGWTLEYIEGLSVARWHEFMQVEDGKAAAKRSIL